MPHAATDRAARPARIAVVDDHPIVRRGLTQLIAQEPDLEVCAEAERAHEALSILVDARPDLAIIDLTLKDVSGLELIKQLQAPLPDLRILVLSMHDENLYAERAIRAGARGYLMKQEGTPALISAIRTVLRGEIYVSPKMATRVLTRLMGHQGEPDGSPFQKLTDRELEVFELLGRGLGTRQIAERLYVSVKTVESHREHIKHKLRLVNATELVQHATQWVLREGVD